MHPIPMRVIFFVTFFFLAAFARAESPARTIVFLGDSLTAGYGLSIEEAYPALIQAKLQAAGLPWSVVNAGVSGDTTSGGLRRLNWILRRPPDAILIALGANDMLRGTDLDTIRSNLENMVLAIRAKHPQTKIVLAGMRATPNLGESYARSFESIYTDLSKKHNTSLIPFLLEGVGGIPSLNQSDGIHPTPDGQIIIADLVWKYLEPVVRGEGK